MSTTRKKGYAYVKCDALTDNAFHINSSISPFGSFTILQYPTTSSLEVEK